MNALAWVLLAVAAAAALANWWSRATHDTTVERVTKPAVMVLLIVLALVLDDVDSGVRFWFVVALVLSLAGDIFLMLPSDRFVAGLASFLLAHVAYAVGALVMGVDAGPWLVLGAAAVAADVAAFGRRIVAGATTADRRLAVPVTAYLGVISAMVLAVTATGDSIAAVGALSFLASDTILGHNRFVTTLRWAPVAIMVPYHVGQALLVVSLA